MNYFDILKPLLNLLYLLPFILIIFIMKSPQFKGRLGEWFVKRQLNNNIIREHILLNDVLIPTKDGTTQLDHILISNNGIWVIETKFYAGYIYGSQKQKQWTQSFGRNKFKFQNPFHQNYKHIKTLSEHLEIPEKNIKNIVIIIGEFKSNHIPSLYTKISNFIIDFENNNEEVFDEYEDIAHKILDLKLKNSFSNKYNHNKHVKEIIKNK